MTLDTGELRNVPKIHGMFEWTFTRVTCLAFQRGEITKFDGMFIRAHLRISFGRRSGVVNHCVTDVAVVSNHLAILADMLSIVTPEASREIEVANVVRMSLPIDLHLGKRIRREDPL